MAKNTSILLGDYYQEIIQEQIRLGKYTSASEVVRAALRLFNHEETKRKELIEALEKGEKSGFVKDFDRQNFLNEMKEKYGSES